MAQELSENKVNGISRVASLELLKESQSRVKSFDVKPQLELERTLREVAEFIEEVEMTEELRGAFTKRIKVAVGQRDK